MKAERGSRRIWHSLIFAPLIFCLIAQTPLALATPPLNTAQTLFEKTRNLVFPLHAALRVSATKASSGSAFIIHRSGLAVTNYHVISLAITEKDRYKLFATLPTGVIEATPIAIDVIHDIAVVKIQKEFPDEILLRTEEMTLGEKLFSIGQPADLNMSIVESAYNGKQKAGPYEQIILSSPINTGMSGGPTLDSHGNLIGVSVAMLRKSQNISFAVPASLLTQMVKESNPRIIASLEGNPWAGIILSQLESAEESLTKEWLTNRQKPLELKGWSILTPPPFLKCGQNRLDKIKGIEARSQDCFTNFHAAPSREVSAGTYEISYITLEKSKKSAFEYYRYLSKAYSTLPLHFISEYFLNKSKSGLSHFTEAECTESIIVNSHLVSLKANVCTKGMKSYGALKDVVIKFITLDHASHSLLVTLRLRGFKSDNIKKIIEALIQSIERNDRVST